MDRKQEYMPGLAPEDASNRSVLTEEEMIRIVKEILAHAKSVDLKVRNEHETEELDEVREKIKQKLDEAIKKYEKLCPETKTPTCEEVDDAREKLRKMEDENPDDPEISAQYSKLYRFYRTKTYSFEVAKIETKNLVVPESFNPSTGLILLCKNVHIMEDVINKVCTNNIDKSIIGGDQQFESMRYGFEWLFCHEDMTVASDDQANEQKHLDIRDINRYLDYIKYQIMVASKYVKKAWKTSEEIDELFGKIEQVYEDLPYDIRQKHLTDFKEKTNKLIETFFDVYELLVTYRDLRFKEEEIRKALKTNGPVEKIDRLQDRRNDSELINFQIINLSSVAVRVLLDRFVSFVKISDLNFGNSTFKRAWFNYSELSKSNYSGSDFKYARIENARMKDCDISTCNLTLADGGNTDFSQSNFTYSNLCGVNLVNAILNGCDFQNVAFTDSNISTYKKALDTIMLTEPKGKKQYQLWITAKELYDNWQNSATLPLSPGDLINDLQEHIKGFSVDDIDTKDVQIPGADNIKPVQRRIIGYNIEKQSKNKKNIYEKHKVLNKRYLSRYISKELVSYIADFENKLEGGKKAARIRDHGKVYWNAANLENAAAKDAKLGGVNLNRVNLSKASFGNSDLSGVSMYYNTAEAASFMESNLNGADCFESNYYQANFSDSVINNAYFMSCNLAYTNWNRAVMINTVFADLSRFLIDQYKDARGDDHSQIFELVTNAPKTEEAARRDDGADVLDGRFWQKSCCLSSASMCNALADRAIFLNIDADRSSFNASSMKASFWFNCKANLADFIETDLRYSLLAHCDLGQSNFTRANMTSMDVRYVDFSDCNLSNVLFNKSKLEHAVFDNADTRNLNFSGAEVRNSVFSNCQLERAIVTNARFENCIFSNVNFVDMIGFRSSEFINCRCIDCRINDGKNTYYFDNDFYERLQEQIYDRGSCSE